MKSLAWWPGFLIFLAGLILAHHANRQESKKGGPENIILIGWDGAGRSNVKEAMAAGELPALEKLASEGNIVSVDVLRTTDTKSGWTQILTGYEPEKTGVFSNYFYGPIPEGHTVFERLEKHFGPKNIRTGAVIAKSIHVDADPPEREPVKGADLEKLKKKLKVGYSEHMLEYENDVAYRVTPAKPYYYTQNGVDLFVNGLKTDRAVGEKTMGLIEKWKDKRFFIFVHFGTIDRLGHMYGEDSQAYRDAYASADLWTGKIMDRLAELGLYEETLVYVTSDHGFDVGKRKHLDAPYVFLATNDPDVQRRGTRADIAPTILERFGLDLETLAPPLDGKPLTWAYTPPLW